jgi:hypothetical protein
LAIPRAAFTTTDSIAPGGRLPAAANPAYGGDWHNGLPVPGSNGQASNSGTASGQFVACVVSDQSSGVAQIGPSGGVLYVGPHRLIVPPGALTQTVELSGVVQPGPILAIQFYPEGLQFQKPAGLVLDVSGCGGPVPDVTYIDEQGGLQEHIRAMYSTWWHTIAAPLDHFSLYAWAI